MLTVNGCKVALWDLNEELGTQLAEELGGAVAKVNVSSEEDVVAGIEVAKAAHGLPRALVNCAGLARSHRIVGKNGQMPLEGYKFVIETNLIGTFNCTRLVANEMMALEPGKDGERAAIVNTASVAAWGGQVGQIAYASLKAGIVGMTLVIARDLSSAGIRCNTIAPGTFSTPLMPRATDEALTSLANSIPFPKRLGRP